MGELIYALWVDIPTLAGFIGAILVAIVIVFTLWVIVLGVGVFVAMCLVVGLVGLLAFMPTDRGVVRFSPRLVPQKGIGPVYAYKLLMSDVHVGFRSPFREMEWEAGWNRVDIEPDWSTGIYSCKTIDVLLDYLPEVHKLLVVRLELAGVIVEHEFGYRSEYARVVGINSTFTHEKLIEAACEYFSAPIFN